MKLSLLKYLPPLHLVNSKETVRKIIKVSQSKSCSLDPLPTWLLKQCLDTLLPVFTDFVNLSLSMATFPDNFKEAILTLLIEKILLDPEILKNFCPISNLRFISKIVKTVVVMYIRDYMTANGLHKLLQSASKNLHNTETALHLSGLLIIPKLLFWCC